MSYLQDKGYIHRDLAARNCLISKHGVVKIADFGLSKIVSELKGNTEALLQVPVRWMSPETLIAAPQFSIKSDVWSYGVLVWEIFSDGVKPFDGWEHKRIATHIRKGKMMDFPEQTAIEVKNLVKECWTLEPSKRCDFKFICKKIAEIQTIYPSPPALECTIALIPGVTALSKDEIGTPLDVSEDIANEIVQSTMQNVPSTMTSPRSALRTVRQEREPTVEDMVPVKGQTNDGLKDNHKEKQKKEEKPKEKHVESLPIRQRAASGRLCIIEKRNSRPSSHEGESKTGDNYESSDNESTGTKRSRSSGPKQKKKSRKEDRVHASPGLKKRHGTTHH